MGYTVVIGDTGTGKTSWINMNIKRLIRTEGPQRLKRSRAKIAEENLKRKIPLTPPDKIPIYANFDSKYQIGYKKFYKPYYIDEEYIGLPNKGKLVIPVAPCSVIALQEMDEEYNSRKPSELVESVTGFFYENRHWELEIFADLHRLMIMDANIRTVANRVVEMRGCENEKNFAGQIIKTTWHYREFDDIKEAQRYVLSDGREGRYREVVDSEEGNIFNCFNTHDKAKDFVPKEGDDFIYLKQPSEIDITKLPPELARFYSKGATLDG